MWQKFHNVWFGPCLLGAHIQICKRMKIRCALIAAHELLLESGLVEKKFKKCQRDIPRDAYLQAGSVVFGGGGSKMYEASCCLVLFSLSLLSHSIFDTSGAGEVFQVFGQGSCG